MGRRDEVPGVGDMRSTAGEVGLEVIRTGHVIVDPRHDDNTDGVDPGVLERRAGRGGAWGKPSRRSTISAKRSNSSSCSLRRMGPSTTCGMRTARCSQGYGAPRDASRSSVALASVTIRPMSSATEGSSSMTPTTWPGGQDADVGATVDQGRLGHHGGVGGHDDLGPTSSLPVFMARPSRQELPHRRARVAPEGEGVARGAGQGRDAGPPLRGGRRGRCG